MKLSEWASGQGVSYRTALNWFHAGTLPVSARQLPTGTILVVNGNRAMLRKVLADPRVSGIVVEHRDRLARFGVEHRAAAVAATGRRIIVVNPDEVKDDL